MRNRIHARAAAVMLLLVFPVIGWALEIDWYTIDGGGGTSGAGFLLLRGTIGQADAGPLTGGTLVLKGGFWASAGLTVTDVASVDGVALPTRHRLSASAPNPSRGHATLQFDLPRKERTRIRVYDITGRLVSTLVDRNLDSGRHEVTWDGRDRTGSRVASGVYLVRMQAGQFGATRKVTRLN